ncbi:MAG: FAD-dependent oxidoreductase [bacterium]|jgi:NADPH-dependent glutamate synthase beta subunit-like oxidoreductase/coenzyme F420-reducing hydrogenase delta subunit/Pyruvate/2-oxoacid:ferredoxin oxidoreductase delta subunit|nr:FAD-dependent oxidoreductase [bacterium]
MTDKDRELTTSILDMLEKGKATLTLSADPSVEYSIERIKKSSCAVGCPADVKIKAYLGLISAGKFDEALELVRQDNPLPGICGRVCTHPCESECNRVDLDEPVAICALKRFIADYELNLDPSEKVKLAVRADRDKVAVIGSGPAGLTAANDLARMGYKVTVFEKLPVAGGMLTSGIPSYRLPRDIILTEIDSIKALGVEIKLDSPVDRNHTLEDLKNEGYKAIFIATGAYKGKKLGIPGEDDFEGFLDSITFLMNVNIWEKDIPEPCKVIVIGGGNAAIDSARTALRLGCDVHIVYRRSRKEMPANLHEIEDAEKEGIKMHYLASPVKIIGENGRVVGMECIKNELGEPDSSGRRRPVPMEGSEFVIDVDLIIPAISQEPDLDWLAEGHGLEISRWNSFVINEDSMATNQPGIFAGGDAVTGPQTVIEAIAAGHTAARSMDRYLRGEDITGTAAPEEKIEYAVTFKSTTKKARAHIPAIPLEDRANFNEVELGLSKEMAVEEANRCLRCGPCQECSECVAECENKLAALVVPGSDQSILLRVPFDTCLFPLENKPIEGRLSCGSDQMVPVVIEPLTAVVESRLCRGCGDCVKVCVYSAPGLEDRGEGVNISRIDPALCKGCGICATVCPSSAIHMNHYNRCRINELSKESAADKQIVAFVCNWAYNMRTDFEEAAGQNLIRVMCSGQIDPGFIVKAFEQGADGVIGIGCPPDACQYVKGNEATEKNFKKAQDILSTLGLEPERVRFERLTPDNPARLQEVMGSFANTIKNL